ncbi:hypothetical protein GGR51DRAFT_568644 [Nemania sp. FL0031]|nr:hypothetical protein GGR51DRAFT_568644 [Nemania sp. FL0031]
MAFPTFPASWTAPTSCFGSTDIWAVIVSRDTQDTDVVLWSYYLGVPATTSTGDCLPPSYATSAPYIGQTCPPGYRNAVASRTTIYNQQAQATLCCPGTDYSFAASGPAGCQTVFGDEAFIATFTDPLIGEQRPTTFSDESGDALNAFGITIISTSSTSSSESATTDIASTTPFAGSHTVTNNPSTSISMPTNMITSPPSPTGLSTGAAAGIGVGVGLGIILLVLGGWILYQKRGKKTPTVPATVNQDVQYAAFPKPTPSPAMSVPGNGPPGSPSVFYQAQQSDFLPSPDALYGQGRPTSELPS